MKRNLFLTAVLIALFSHAFNAQTVIDFESLTVPEEGYYNGSTDYSGSGSAETFTYEDDIANFYITYTDDGDYQYWNSFAYSNQMDKTTTGYTNYSSYADHSVGGGADGSSNYIFNYVSSYATGGSDSIMFDQTINVNSVEITNSTYAYLYMDGTDPYGYEYTTDDYFILTITGIRNDNTVTGSVDFYLADFTNGNAYIIDDWTTVDLSSLGNVDGLKFKFSSSDTGDYGINTPTYYCLDNIKYSPATSVSNFESSNFAIYPNPAKSIVNINNVLNANISINDISGKTVLTKNNCLENERINISNLNSGIYFITIENNNKTTTKKLIVE
ncbi:MAG: DUF4465 domain-containing protein [Chlorobi bacterium]|nr:DUF4465 domain-containing protein [Chlorobiota bacterium]